MDFQTDLTQWQPNVRRCLQEQWQRITTLLDELPEDEHIDYDDLTERQQQCVQYIDAIEEEWIIDDDQRRELSVLIFD